MLYRLEQLAKLVIVAAAALVIVAAAAVGLVMGDIWLGSHL